MSKFSSEKKVKKSHEWEKNGEKLTLFVYALGIKKKSRPTDNKTLFEQLWGGHEQSETFMKYRKEQRVEKCILVFAKRVEIFAVDLQKKRKIVIRGDKEIGN